MASDRLKRAKNINFAASMVSEIGGLATSFAQAQAIQGQAGYRSTLAQINSRFASMESRDIIKQGNKRAIEQGKNIKQLVGKQKAGFASGNVLVGDGTAAQIENQTIEIGQEEQRNIRNNAWKQAFGIRQQARSAEVAADNAKRQADFESKNTLIAGALSAIGGVAGGVSSFTGSGFDPGSYKTPSKGNK